MSPEGMRVAAHGHRSAGGAIGLVGMEGELFGEQSIEGALDAVREAAKQAMKASKEFDAAAKAIDKAAASGELAKLRTGLNRALGAAAAVDRSAGVVERAWPWTDSDEEALIASTFMLEVAAALRDQGVELNPYGSGWSASPVLVSVDPKSRSVRIDRIRRTALRPSLLAEAIVAARRKPSTKPIQFIETLLAGYRAAVGTGSVQGELGRTGASVQLTEIYRLLTLLPDARRTYSLEDFARDLFALDRSGVAETKDGWRLFLSSSTSSKSGGGVLTVLDERGAPQHYFAAAFRQVAS